MIQKDKELLLKNLSARLPYGVKAQVTGWDEEKGEIKVPLKLYSINTDGYLSFEYNHYSVETVYVEDCRLYLRPMSSLTEDEKRHVNDIIDEFADRWLDSDVAKDKWDATFWQCSEIVNYLNSIHIDYHGLIPKGLAIEAPEGMYKCITKKSTKNMSYNYFPSEFSSYEDYVKYLKKKGFAIEVIEENNHYASN